MHVHRFEKLWFGAALLLIVAFIATIVYGAAGPGVAMVSDDGGTIDADKVANGNFNQTDNFRSPGVYRENGQVHVYIVARQFLFNPGTSQAIEVPANEQVTFHVTSADVMHGFNLVGTNVNSMVIPGQVATFSVTFDETGSYGIVCHEYCGSGHHTMAGKLTVVSQSQFELAPDADAVEASGGS
ncbi:MAG: cytochrome c oxidase subunit II [Halobaculum sp.]